LDRKRKGENDENGGREQKKKEDSNIRDFQEKQ
jgi:hypothetical protein